MSIRLMICEPDEQLRERYISYFKRATDFEWESASDVNQCLLKKRRFGPNVIILEPEFPSEATFNFLDKAGAPVLVLSRFRDQEAIELHPAVFEYFVKPKSLSDIVIAIERIADPRMDGS